MAKGFGEGFNRFRRDMESLPFLGPVLAAERIVAELQAEGPSWTGRFSNSWQITGPQGQQVKGDGKPGDPRPVKFKEGPFTGPQAAATFLRTKLTTDKVVFTISNFADHAAKAIDAVEQDNFLYPRGWVISPDGPSTQLGKAKFDPVAQGRKGGGSYRGDTGGGDPDSSSSRTAPLDWFATFAEGGRLDKAVRISVDEALRKAFK
jgi:hypothetical protein